MAPVKPALVRVARTALVPGTAHAVALPASWGLGTTGAILTCTAAGEPRAWLNRCPHARWPLDTFDGRFLFTNDGALICAAHGALFDPGSGQCLGGPGRGAPLTALPLDLNDPASIGILPPCA